MRTRSASPTALLRRLLALLRGVVEVEVGDAAVAGPQEVAPVGDRVHGDTADMDGDAFTVERQPQARRRTRKQVRHADLRDGRHRGHCSMHLYPVRDLTQGISELDSELVPEGVDPHIGGAAACRAYEAVVDVALAHEVADVEHSVDHRRHETAEHTLEPEFIRSPGRDDRALQFAEGPQLGAGQFQPAVSSVHSPSPVRVPGQQATRFSVLWQMTA